MSSPRSGAEIARDISNGAVKLIAEYTGRGPTKARTTLSGAWVFITLQDTLTKGERQLALNGQGETVLQLRKQYQTIMRADLEAVVTQHTGRKVLAFMSENHIDPDVAIEAFLLEPDGDVVAAADIPSD